MKYKHLNFKIVTKSSGTSGGLVWDHTSDASPHNFSWESQMEWSFFWVGESSFSHEIFEF